MTLRSLLFVPGDSEKKMAKAASTGADALLLDLEDAVSQDRLPLARGLVLEYLSNHKRKDQQVWVRINPLNTALSLPDLVAVMPGKPDGIVLPKPLNASDVQQLDHFLSALEQREGIAVGSTRILPVATELAGSLFELQSYAGCSARLAGLTWGAEDLATDIGATTNKKDNGEFDDTFVLARSLCLLASAHAGVQAIDTLNVDFRNDDGLKADVQRARRQGFSGKLAIHPDQVAIINAGFTATHEELQYAQQIVDAFTQAGGAGAVQLDGKMIDKPHLTQALRLLATKNRN
ncbi:MAG: CoA ester lyase [Betaproteobacteria bacterium]|nr:CoA ester lyase [Betaproteobacteria bacterium]